VRAVLVELAGRWHVRLAAPLVVLVLPGAVVARAVAAETEAVGVDSMVAVKTVK